MSAALQASLLDLTDEIALGPLGSAVTRQPLGSGAWIDVRRGWLSGADALFDALLAEVPWRAEEREMYQRMVAAPRLLGFYGEGAPLPHPVLEQARDLLSAHYADELGEPFRTAGLCLYRDGRDSVAWHGDRIGRGRTTDTMVAILSLGETRRLMLRPNGGGAGQTMTFALGHGDLVVMGGSCQRTWEHCVPKS